MAFGFLYLPLFGEGEHFIHHASFNVITASQSLILCPFCLGCPTALSVSGSMDETGKPKPILTRQSLSGGVKNATARFELPKPAVAVRNLVRISTHLPAAAQHPNAPSKWRPLPPHPGVTALP